MPPTPIKQNPTTATPTRLSPQSIMSRILPVKQPDVDRQKWAIYGVAKAGKTRFVCSFKKPMLLIGAEDGTASVAGTKGLEFIHVQSLAEFNEVVDLVKGGKWASVAVDTLSKLRDMRINELFAVRGGPVPDKKPFMYASQAWKDVWTQTGKDLKNSLGTLLDLPRTQALNVLIISQEANLTYDDGSGASSELLRPAIGSAVGKSMCDWLHAECDYIGQMVIRRETIDEESEIGIIKKPTGKNEHCLRVMSDGIYQAGFRLPEGRVLTNEFIVNPNYEKIVELIKGKS